MRQQIELVAALREDVGKGASRRLRRAGEMVPGIIYGGEREPQPLTLDANALKKATEQESFYSQILNVVVDGDPQQAVVRDLQRNPASDKVSHIDFLRVSADHAIEVHIPLHFLNEEKCVGARMHDGSIVHNMNEVEIRCLPKDLPEYIEVDMAAVDVGESIHLSELKLPPNVTIVALAHGEEYDAAVVTVLSPRGGGAIDEEAEEAAEVAAAAAAAPVSSAEEEAAAEEEGGDEEASGKSDEEAPRD